MQIQLLIDVMMYFHAEMCAAEMAKDSAAEANMAGYLAMVRNGKVYDTESD